MTPALSAKLLELEAIRRLLLVLGRDVVPVLALGALKRDVVPWHNSSTLVAQPSGCVDFCRLKSALLRSTLLDDLSHRPCAYRSSAFPDRKP
jgi:hypothetical protein